MFMTADKMESAAMEMQELEKMACRIERCVDELQVGLERHERTK